MNDAAVVRVIQGAANLDGKAQRLVERQVALERLALDILHDQVVWADIV